MLKESVLIKTVIGKYHKVLYGHLYGHIAFKASIHRAFIWTFIWTFQKIHKSSCEFFIKQAI